MCSPWTNQMTRETFIIPNACAELATFIKHGSKVLKKQVLPNKNLVLHTFFHPSTFPTSVESPIPVLPHITTQHVINYIYVLGLNRTKSDKLSTLFIQIRNYFLVLIFQFSKISSFWFLFRNPPLPQQLHFLVWPMHHSTLIVVMVSTHPISLRTVLHHSDSVPYCHL